MPRTFRALAARALRSASPAEHIWGHHWALVDVAMFADEAAGTRPR